MTANVWGIPNWVERSAYPAELTDRQWWWEFTRRRPDYRALWETASASRPVEHDTCLANDYQSLRLEFEMSRLLDPTKSYSDSQLSWHRYPRNHGYSNRGGYDEVEVLKSVLDRPETVEEFEDHLAEMRREAELHQQAGGYFYVFDLKRPLTQQLEQAEKHLRLIQDELYGEQKRTAQKIKWPSYLRVLDARDLKASWSQIGAVLWPGDRGDLVSRARAHYAAAEGVRDRFPISPM